MPYIIKKYVIYAGWMVSETDDQMHWVTADALIGLYKLNPRECVVARGGNIVGRVDVPNPLHLGPQYHYENYVIPPDWDFMWRPSTDFC